MKSIPPQSPSPDANREAHNCLIPLMEPCMTGNEWEYVKECFRSNWFSSGGPFVTRFEQATAQWLETEHAVATASGTSALHIALLVAGLKPDEEVLVSSLTFIATANAVRYVGGWPVFVDADPLHFQMDPEKTRDFLDRECRWHKGTLIDKATGRKVRALLPTDLNGHPVDADPLLEVAAKYDLVVIEDAAQGLGAHYKGRKAGTLGNVACLSFNGNKIVTSGGGGMILTDRERWAEKARYLTTQARDSTGEYLHAEIGYNYRLSNIHAAIGLAQVEKLEEYVDKKRSIASYYTQGLHDLPALTLPCEASWARSTYWMYAVQVDGTKGGPDRHELRRCLADRHIRSGSLWAPLHQQPPYHNCRAYYIETAPKFHQQSLSLPSSVGLTLEDQNRVIEAVRDRVLRAS